MDFVVLVGQEKMRDDDDADDDDDDDDDDDADDDDDDDDSPWCVLFIRFCRNLISIDTYMKYVCCIQVTHVLILYMNLHTEIYMIKSEVSESCHDLRDRTTKISQVTACEIRRTNVCMSVTGKRRTYLW